MIEDAPELAHALADLRALAPSLLAGVLPGVEADLAEAEALAPALRPEHRAFLAASGASAGSLELRVGHAQYDTSLVTVLPHLRRRARRSKSAEGTLVAVATTCQDCGPLVVAPGGEILKLDDGEEPVEVARSLPVLLVSLGVRQVGARLGALVSFSRRPDPALAPVEAVLLVGEALLDRGFVRARTAYQDEPRLDDPAPDVGRSALALFSRGETCVLLADDVSGRVLAPERTSALTLVRQVSEIVPLDV